MENWPIYLKNLTLDLNISGTVRSQAFKSSGYKSQQADIQVMLTIIVIDEHNQDNDEDKARHGWTFNKSQRREH